MRLSSFGDRLLWSRKIKGVKGFDVFVFQQSDPGASAHGKERERKGTQLID